MIKNHLKIALRHMQRHRGYAFINIFSLSIGLACCTVVMLYIHDERSYDRFHEHVDQIYRIVRVEQRGDGTTKRSEGSPVPLAPALAADLPHVAHTLRLRNGPVLVQHDAETYTEQVLFSDASFFEVFSFPLKGHPPRPLDAPDAVVISAAMADKYFGDADPMGATLSLQIADGFESFTVTGVAEPLPSQSSITFDFLLPFTRWPGYARAAERWSSFTNTTFIHLTDAAETTAVQQQLNRLVPQYFGGVIRANQDNGWWVAGDDAFRLTLQPLTAMHLSPEVTNFVIATGNPDQLYLLAGIALLVLLLACFNFTTLAIGRAAGRAREVGVRKSLGAHRLQLMQQFWGEAFLLGGFGLLVGLVLADVLLPAVNELAATNLAFSYAVAPFILAGLGVVTIFCGIVAGGYPALVLSGFRPVQALKGEVEAGHQRSFSRALVVFQFTASIVLLACTFVIFDQIDYVKTKPLGFADEEVVVLPLPAHALDQEATLTRLKQQVAGYRDVLHVTGTSYAFGDGWARVVMEQGERQHIVYTTRVDPAYLETLGLPLVAGRNFSEDRPTDREGAVLVNETLVRTLGWTEAVGQPLPGYEGVTVIGVVADHHFQSLHQAIEPTFLHMSPALGSMNYAMVRIRTQDIPATLAFLEQSWHTIAPDRAFTYEFLDQRLDQQYQAEERWGQIMQYVALLAILIAGLGLFGLATLTVARRTKEVGIRKVLGASVPGLTLLLAREFAGLVLLAFLVACPLVYLVMTPWLDAFAYHVAIRGPLLVLAGVLALGIALMTVSYQAIRAALSDPVKALRYE